MWISKITRSSVYRPDSERNRIYKGRRRDGETVFGLSSLFLRNGTVIQWLYKTSLYFCFFFVVCERQSLEKSLLHLAASPFSLRGKSAAAAAAASQSKEEETTGQVSISSRPTWRRQFFHSTFFFSHFIYASCASFVRACVFFGTQAYYYHYSVRHFQLILLLQAIWTERSATVSKCICNDEVTV